MNGNQTINAEEELTYLHPLCNEDKLESIETKIGKVGVFLILIQFLHGIH